MIQNIEIMIYMMLIELNILMGLIIIMLAIYNISKISEFIEALKENLRWKKRIKEASKYAR